MNVFGLISQWSPIMTGPLNVVWLWMTVPSPIATLFNMVAVSSIRLWFYGLRL